MEYAIIITAAILFIVGCVCLYLHIWGDSKPLEHNSPATKFIALKRLWICLLIVALVIFAIYCLCPYYKGERWYITWTILAIISLVTILSTSLLLIAEFVVAIVKRQYGTTATLAFWGAFFSLYYLFTLCL